MHIIYGYFFYALQFEFGMEQSILSHLRNGLFETHIH